MLLCLIPNNTLYTSHTSHSLASNDYSIPTDDMAGVIPMRPLCVWIKLLPELFVKIIKSEYDKLCTYSHLDLFDLVTY